MSTETAPPKSTGGIADLKKMFGGGSSSLRQFGILFSLIAIIVVPVALGVYLLRPRRRP